MNFQTKSSVVIDSSLAWIAIILIVLGLVVTSLARRFAFFVLASIFAIIPALFAKKRARIFAMIIFVISLALTFDAYPSYIRHMKEWAR